MSQEKSTVIIEEIIKKYKGKIENPDAMSKIKGTCGDEMEFSIKIKDNKVEEIKYFSSGCAYTLASGALVCFYAENRSIEEASFISPGLISKTLGELPEDHKHCPMLACMSFYQAIGDWLIKK